MSSFNRDAPSVDQNPDQFSVNETDLVTRTRSGDEDAFLALLNSYNPAITRIASIYASHTDAAARLALVVWAEILRTIGYRDSNVPLKLWMLQTAVRLSRAASATDGREQENAATWNPATAPEIQALPSDRFLPDDDPEYPHYWNEYPPDWQAFPEELFDSKDSQEQVATALGSLPLSEREVVVLRDVEGFSIVEVSHILGVSDTNQLLLLHRGRSRVRTALEQYVDARMRG